MVRQQHEEPPMGLHSPTSTRYYVREPEEEVEELEDKQRNGPSLYTLFLEQYGVGRSLAIFAGSNASPGPSKYRARHQRELVNIRSNKLMRHDQPVTATRKATSDFRSYPM